jgi:hypothetical protein
MEEKWFQNLDISFPWNFLINNEIGMETLHIKIIYIPIPNSIVEDNILPTILFKLFEAFTTSITTTIPASSEEMAIPHLKDSLIGEWILETSTSMEQIEKRSKVNHP